MRATRRFFLIAALILVAISLAAYLTPLLVPVPPRVIGAISWRPTAIGATVTIGLLIREVRGAWVTLIIGICAFGLPPIIAQQPTLATLATFSQSLLVGLVMGFVGAITLRLSRSADIAGEGREHAAAAAAASAGASAARARAAALVHDEVLSALHLAAAPKLVDPQQLAAHADHARALLADASSDERHASPVEALWADVRAIDPDAEMPVTVWREEQLSNARATQPAPELPISAIALPAIRGALRQAVRNSQLHAGPRARRRISIEHDATGLRATVVDDGVGFDPAAVSVLRLGLRTTAQAIRSVGGEIVVHSGVGSGTRVVIGWPAATLGPAGRAQRATRATQASHSGHGAAHPSARFAGRPLTDAPKLGDVPLVRVGATVATAAFLVTQAILAAVATGGAASWWLPILVLALQFTAALMLVRSYDTRLSTARTTVVLCIVAASLITGLLGAPFEVGDLWFAGAAAFLFTAIAFRGRPLSALAGGVLLTALLITSGVANGAAPFVIASVTVRPLAVTLFAVGLTLAITSLLRRIAHELAGIEAESAREAWQQSARTELAERASEVRLLVDDVLGEIASGAPLTAQSRARATAIEGHLRDRIRAGRLALEPLFSAVMRARERGVDVLLLDDLEGELPTGFNLPFAARHIARACAEADESVTVRVLPAGRSSVISLVVDGLPVTLPRDEAPDLPQNH